MLTEQKIRECADDKELLKLLSAELNRRLPGGEGADLDKFLQITHSMPRGLRAMAAIYQLDVSMALDDLGWHFANWNHRAYCEETLWALKELEAKEEAEIFAEAWAIVQPYWDKIGRLKAIDFKSFTDWYDGSELEKNLDPLNRRLWDSGTGTQANLLRYWVSYARKYPERVAGD